MKKIILSLLVFGALAGGIVRAADDAPATGGALAGAGGPDFNAVATEALLKLFDSLPFASSIPTGDHDAILIRVQELLNDGADPNAQESGLGYTPLCTAIENGLRTVVTLLLTLPGIDVNKPNMMGKTPLHLASHLVVVAQLITAPGINLNPIDKQGFTPLHRAVHESDRAKLQALIAAGADMNQVTPVPGQNPVPAMHLAAAYGDLGMVRALLEAGADVGQDPEFGNTPLHCAAASEYGRMPGRLEEGLEQRLSLVRTLLAQPALDLAAVNQNDETALELATRLGNNRIAQLIRAEITARERRWSALRAGWLSGLVAATKP